MTGKNLRSEYKLDRKRIMAESSNITFQDIGFKCFKIKSDALWIGLISRYMGIYKVAFNENSISHTLTAEELDHISDKIKDLNR